MSLAVATAERKKNLSSRKKRINSLLICYLCPLPFLPAAAAAVVNTL